MLEKFTSVTKATLKGSAVIGILQGGLAGIAFAVVGIPSAVFWGAIMTVLSIIPSIGSAIIWLPAAIILAATGHIIKAIGLGIFCAVIVGSLDNVLRPILVGKDTEMHELMIFLGTLGGIFMFGVICQRRNKQSITRSDIYQLWFQIRLFRRYDKSQRLWDRKDDFAFA